DQEQLPQRAGAGRHGLDLHEPGQPRPGPVLLQEIGVPAPSPQPSPRGRGSTCSPSLACGRGGWGGRARPSIPEAGGRPQMLSHLIRRLIAMVPTLVIVSVLTFIIIQLPPGDFLTTLSTQASASGGSIDEAAMDALRKQYGLDQPMYVSISPGCPAF